MADYRTNRKTRGTFPLRGGLVTMTQPMRTGRTLSEIFDDLALKGPYLQQTAWLKDHGFAYFSERDTPEGYVWETWVDNFGNAVRFKWERPSGETMERAMIVDAMYIPKPESPTRTSSTHDYYPGPLGEISVPKNTRRCTCGAEFPYTVEEVARHRKHGTVERI